MSTAVRFQTKGILDPHRQTAASCPFEEALRQRIVGQDDSVRALVELYQVFCAGLNAPGRPVGNLLFLGPTGVGKTHIVEAAAEVLFGDARAIIKVDCAEFQHSHEISKLIGSPPGYLGHRETHPLITQEALAKNHQGDLKLSFLLFDEIEKASDALWQLLLGILDKGTLTLGDNRRVDLSQTIIFMTSNLGAVQMTEIMTGGMGFVRPSDTITSQVDEKLERTAVEAARHKFSPEFINRLDKLVVFRPLRREQLEEVLQIELQKVQSRVSHATDRLFLFRISENARQFLLDEGTDQRYGARHLNRTIERFLIHPLARLLATDQLRSGDRLLIDLHPAKNCLAFARDTEHYVPYAGVALGDANPVCRTSVGIQA
jgi:ATP-dependent Clp protease ATP-binding subunit ClpB